MVDTRFHTTSGPLALDALLATLGQQTVVKGAPAKAVVLIGAEELDTAGPRHLALAASDSYLALLRDTEAGAIVVHPALLEAVPPSAVALVSERPHDLFVSLLERLYPLGTRGIALGMFDPAGAAPFLEEGVLLGTNVVLGKGVEIGRNTIIGANSVIGSGVTIGRNAVIGPNVSIECAYLGNGVVIHAGARIGTEGFGWLEQGRGNRKVPQLGRVIIQDKAEIGANSTIDRGALGDTVIGEGTKIDNLVQIGHNCRIGRYCLIAAHCGLAGSTVLEDSVLMGGRASSTGHLTVGAGSAILAIGVATKDIPPGSKVGGFPAQDVRQWRQEIAMLRRLAKGAKSGR